MRRSKGADFFQVFLFDLEANPSIEHRRRCSPQYKEITGRSILLRRITWSGLSLAYHWRRSSMISFSKISYGPIRSLSIRGLICLNSTSLLLWWLFYGGVCRIRSRSNDSLQKRSLWRGTLQRSEEGTLSWPECVCPRSAGQPSAVYTQLINLLAHSGKCAKGCFGVKGRPSKSCFIC